MAGLNFSLACCQIRSMTLGVSSMQPVRSAIICSCSAEAGSRMPLKVSSEYQRSLLFVMGLKSQVSAGTPSNFMASRKTWMTNVLPWYQDLTVLQDTLARPSATSSTTWIMQAAYQARLSEL